MLYSSEEWRGCGQWERQMGAWRHYHTTLHTTAGLHLKLSRVGPSQFLDGRPDAAGCGVGGPVGGTLSISQCARAVIALCRVLSFGWDVKRVSWLSEVIKRSHGTYRKSRGVNPGVLAKFPIWPSNHYGHLIIPSLQLAHSSPSCNYSPGFSCKWERVLSQLTW